MLIGLLHDQYVIMRFARENIITATIRIVASKASNTRLKRMAIPLLYAFVVSKEVHKPHRFALCCTARKRHTLRATEYRIFLCLTPFLLPPNCLCTGPVKAACASADGEDKGICQS